MRPRRVQARSAAAVLAMVALAAAAPFVLAMAYDAWVAAPRTLDAERSFRRLPGPERRLRIYDAFTAAVDRNYFDRDFSGFDWPALKRAWRPRAAAAKDDADLYRNVLNRLARALPVSHVAAVPPQATRPLPGAPRPEDYTAHDAGFDPEPLRRGRDEVVVVGEVWPGSEAAAAGLQPGSVIRAMRLVASPGGGRVDGRVTCLTPADSLRLEAGRAPLPALAPVSCRPGADPRASAIAYGFAPKPAEPGVAIGRLPGGALHVRFDAFEAPQMGRALAALRQAGPAGAVLDLRFNAGGYVMPVLAALVGSNVPVYRVRDVTGVHVRRTPRVAWTYRGPLALIVGPGSQSAAEVTAAVVQARGRGRVVGRPTNGAVLEAALFPLPDGGAAEVPVEEIAMLDGRRLEAAGVIPDVAIYPRAAQLQRGEDPARDAAVAALGSVGGQPKSAAPASAGARPSRWIAVHSAANSSGH